ncbi:MAG: HAMP domain-containing histidine kinase [Planctomycetes bacterium]|nr:HAMP domain-containing histidine kinase [Planctomycetota bacterium]
MLATRSPAAEETFHGRVLPLLRSPSLAIVGEFLAALRSPHAWNPLRNGYVVFGILWGLPIPLFSLGLDLLARGSPFSPTGLWEAVALHPIHLFFLAHPLIFGVVFGAMGTVRHAKDAKIERLVGELEERLGELAVANEALRSLDKLKSEFLANVSHELRTPLVSIRGYNEMIQEGRFGPINEKQAEGLTIALRNVDRLLDLITDLLDFARLQEGKRSLSLSRFDLREAVTAAVTLLRPRLEEKSLKLILRLPEEPCVLAADRDKLGRMILNLLANAMKFTEPEGEVGLELTHGESGYALRIWDTGCGIPAHLHTRVFERFWQGDGTSRRKYGGTGLGLAIVKEIVEAHGGRIDFQSAEGKGTEMRVSLPSKGT